MLRMLNHVRSQVDAGGLMALLRQNAGEEAGSRADVQDPKRSALRKILPKLREPAILFFALEFTQALCLKAFGPVCPVV